MKEHQLEHKHQRYYIFRHVKGEDILYRTSEGSWTEDFHEAKLWANYKFTQKKAKQLYADEKSHSSYRNEQYVIGRVDVAVDGYFPMETVK